jgi:protein SCO1/2
MKATTRRLLVCLVLLCGLSWPLSIRAHHTAQHEIPGAQNVGLDQRLQAFIPLDLMFRDETGRPVALKEYFGTQPVILTLAYYDCPHLCTLVLNGLLRTLRALSLTAGEQFTVLTVSIDPADTPAQAAAKKAQYLRGYGRDKAADGWHFLTGEPEAIQRLTQAVGFRYTYDADKDQFFHASGIMILTPQGQLARYFYGIEYAPREVRLGLVEASANRIGSPIDQLLLLCYQYDPQSGTYSLVILRGLRVAGIITVLALATFMGVMFRHERHRTARSEQRR